MLEQMCQTQLHLISKYNYHMSDWSRRNSLAYLFNPVTNAKNWRDASVLKQLSERTLGVHIESAEERFNTARRVHDALENALSGDKRTFFDLEMKEELKVSEEEKEPGVTTELLQASLDDQIDLSLSRSFSSLNVPEMYDEKPPERAD